MILGHNLSLLEQHFSSCSENYTYLMVTMMMQKHLITWHAGVIQILGSQDDGCQVDECPEGGYKEFWSVPVVCMSGGLNT